jgi:hypothetical protein
VHLFAPASEQARFQIQVFHRLTTEERLHLLNGVVAQKIGEEFFLHSSTTIASGCRS